MTEKEILAKITQCSLEELAEHEKELIQLAQQACQQAYAPYSHFSVGAAVLLDNQQKVIGNNQENAAFPSGLCAERVALFAAHAHYPQAAIRCLAVAAGSVSDGAFRFTQQAVTPCGACRQVLIESERRSKQPIAVLMYGQEGVLRVESASVLLPLCFSLT